MTGARRSTGHSRQLSDRHARGDRPSRTALASTACRSHGVQRRLDVELAVVRGSAHLSTEHGSITRARRRAQLRTCRPRPPTLPSAFNARAIRRLQPLGRPPGATHALGNRPSPISPARPPDVRRHASTNTARGITKPPNGYSVVPVGRLRVASVLQRVLVSSLRPYGWTWIGATPGAGQRITTVDGGTRTRGGSGFRSARVGARLGATGQRRRITSAGVPSASTTGPCSGCRSTVGATRPIGWFVVSRRANVYAAATCMRAASPRIRRIARSQAVPPLQSVRLWSARSDGWLPCDSGG